MRGILNKLQSQGISRIAHMIHYVPHHVRVVWLLRWGFQCRDHEPDPWSRYWVRFYRTDQTTVTSTVHLRNGVHRSSYSYSRVPKAIPQWPKECHFWTSPQWRWAQRVHPSIATVLNFNSSKKACLCITNTKVMGISSTVARAWGRSRLDSRCKLETFGGEYEGEEILR